MFTGLLCQVRKPCGTNIEANSAQLGNCVQVVMLPLHVDLYCTLYSTVYMCNKNARSGKTGHSQNTHGTRNDFYEMLFNKNVFYLLIV